MYTKEYPGYEQNLGHGTYKVLKEQPPTGLSAAELVQWRLAMESRYRCL